MKTKILVLSVILIAVTSIAQSIPPEAKKTVAFVYFADNPTNSSPDGTGFFVVVDHTNDQHYGYFVTARHVLRPPPNNQWLSAIYIRVNRTDGTAERFFVPISATGEKKNVFTHQDSTVDIAVIPFVPQPISNYDVCVLPMDMIPNEADFKRFDIREGSDVFFTGMFLNHLGEKQNTPIARFGKVALITDEKIDWATGKTPMYLIEANSYPGNSGSPVFFNIGMQRGNIIYMSGATIRLAGIMSGTYNDIQMIQTVSVSTNQFVTPNMGIAGVVPSYELKDILYCPELKAQRGEQ